MNAEYKKGIDDFVDKYFMRIKEEFELDGTIPPEVFFFFKYTNGTKPFGHIPLPFAGEFFASAIHKQFLKQHIQENYTAFIKEFAPRLKHFNAEVIAVIVMTDKFMYA